MLTGSFMQTAVSKLLGLVTLRLADSVIIPLNTTHYALEFHAYLDEYVADTLLAHAAL